MDRTHSTPGAPDRSRAPGPGPLRPFHFPPIERFSLPNGIPVLAVHIGGLPVVTLSVLVHAAGVHEDAARAGLASLTGSALESGAAGRSAAEIADAVEMLGVQLGVGTGWDVTHVELTGLRSRLAPATEILAQVLRQPTFPDDEVERIRKEQLASILQRRAEPRGLANEAASRFIFAEQSPFARPLGGTADSLEGLTRTDLETFHAEHFSPLSSVVLVAGDLMRDDAEVLLTQAFGDWAGPPRRHVEVAVQPRSERREVILVDRPGAVQSEIRIGQVGVARSTPDYFPIVLMNSILGGAFTSRLNMNLRERHGFTYGVTSSFVMRREPGPFLISTAVQTEVTAAALAETFKEMEGIRAEPVTETELRDARTYLAGVFPLRLQTSDGVASRLAELALHDLPDDFFDTYRDRVLAVEREEVHRAAREHLDPERMTVVVVGDASKIRASIEDLGLGPVEVVQPDILP